MTMKRILQPEQLIYATDVRYVRHTETLKKHVLVSVTSETYLSKVSFHALQMT